MQNIRIFAVLFFSIWAQFTAARITLPSHFTDNMVLQQQRRLLIRGHATPRHKVTLRPGWDKQEFSTTADEDGRFLLQVQTPKAGGPYTLTFSDEATTILSNVMVGEVWLGSGQSNMEMPMAGWGKVLNYEEEIRNANYPEIRLLQVKKVTSVVPLEEAQVNMNGWQECTPATVENFSALCYFYALNLWKELQVPIGVIDDDWGGTPVEAWTSWEALEGIMGYEIQARKVKELGYDRQRIEQWYTQLHQEYRQAVIRSDAGTQQGKAAFSDPDAADTAWPEMQLPAIWENTELGPMDGVVWFRRTVEIPQGWAGKDLQISMGNADDLDVTWWNGVRVGSTDEYSQPLLYTIPGKYVNAGKNLISIRVFDTGGNGGLASAANTMFLACGGEKISLAGTWKYHLGVNAKDLPKLPLSLDHSNHPAVLYNAMIHPFLEFPLAGFIWYQGCNNVGRSEQYQVNFQRMIGQWREDFKNPDLPFYFVQLANYLQPSDLQPESQWALLRESQADALCLPNTGMAVNIDLGDAGDIHPKTKKQLAKRLSALALNKTYGKNIPAEAPSYQSYSVKDGKILVRLSTPSKKDPLVMEDNLKGFIIAGPDRKWHVAKAEITPDGVISIWSPEVRQPVAARYGWADNPTCTLRTRSDLHVAPFRTDRW